MKILLLTAICYPETDLKGLPFAKELQKKGHQVQILTTYPNYPLGYIFEGYKQKIIQREIIEGVEVIRVPIYPSHDTSAIKRIFTYVSFALSASTIGLFAVRKADVMYVYHPPGTIGIPAVLIKYLRRIPSVYDVLDIWPDSLAFTGMVNNKLVLKIISIYSKFVYKLMNRITCLSEGYKKILIERGVKPEKIKVIYNWAYETKLPNASDSRDLLRKEFGFEGSFVFLYAGNIGPAQGSLALIHAAELLQKEQPEIKICFLGEGMEKAMLQEQVRIKNLDNVLFLPRVSGAEVGKYLVAADVMIVHLKTDALSPITIPSKIQSYMQAGRPILIGVDGDSARLVSDAQCGLSCIPENPESIADIMVKFLKLGEDKLIKMGENGKTFYQEHLSLEVGTEEYLSIFNELISK